VADLERRIRPLAPIRPTRAGPISARPRGSSLQRLGQIRISWRMGWRERGATRKGIRGSKRVGGLRLPPSLSELRRTDPRCDLFHRSSELNNVSEGGRAVEWVLIKVGVHRRHVYGTQIIAAGEASRGRVAPRETTSRRASPKRSTETRHGPVMAAPQRHRGVCANALERGRRRPRGAEPRAIISSRYARNGFQIVVPPNCSQKSILTDLIMNRSGNFFPLRYCPLFHDCLSS
jgi:hypothetical protein